MDGSEPTEISTGQRTTIAHAPVSDASAVAQPVQTGISRLRPCPACGQAVSRSGLLCPHCGQPLRTGPVISMQLVWFCMIFTLVVMGIAGYLMNFGRL